MFKNPGRIISKFQFSKLFSSAWSKGMTISNITSAFRNTGICPLNFFRDFPHWPLKKILSLSVKSQLVLKFLLNLAKLNLNVLLHVLKLKKMKLTVNGLQTKFNYLKGDGKMATMSTVIQSTWRG